MLNFAGQVDKNAKITQLEKILATQYPETVAILKDGPGGPNYQAAQAQVVQLAQALFGLEPGGTGYYDGQLTTGVLADKETIVGSRDAQGATVTDPNRSDYGKSYLDVSNTDKAGLMTSAGHEVIESKVLQGKEGLFFQDSFETKERIADLFGESLTASLNDLTGGGLSQTTGDCPLCQPSCPVGDFA